MSPREQLANDIAAWVAGHGSIFTDPPVQELIPRDDGGPGFGRSIKFGITGVVDIQIVVWGTSRIDLTTSLTPERWTRFTQGDDLYQFLLDSFKE